MKKFIDVDIGGKKMKLSFLQNDKYKEQVIMIAVDKIKPNPYQPRTGFEQKEIDELAESIKSYGVIQPVTVRDKGDFYQLVAGERRLRASKKLGLEKIPALVKELQDQEVAEIALIENLQRKDLNFMEEAIAYKKLLDAFNLTQQELAEKIGKSQSTIANKLRLLTLESAVQRKLDCSIITERHARALLKLKDKKQQLEVIEKIKDEKLTVKDTEKLINKLLSTEKKKKRKVFTVYKDLRIFTNTLKKTIDEMKHAGLDVEVDKADKEEFIEFTIRLPKKQ